MKTLLIGVFASSLLWAQTQQTGRQVTPADLERPESLVTTPVTPQEALVTGRVQFEGVITKVGDDRVALQPVQTEKTALEAETLVIGATALADLKIPLRQPYRILAAQRRHGGGIVSVLKLQDARGLYYLSERILDQPLVGAPDRDGWTIEQKPSAHRTLVLEDGCRILYNVPTVFHFGDRFWELNVGEAMIVDIGNVKYKVSLNESHFVALKECRTPFEGGRSDVQYTIVREQTQPPKSR
jgi:hypothetical protein